MASEPTVQQPAENSKDAEARETTMSRPVPEPLKLFVFEKPADVPSSSYYCQKLETYLRITGIPYSTQYTLPFSAPKGKLPFVQFPHGEKLPDSFFIIQRLSSNGQGRDLDEHLGPERKTDSQAWVGWIDDRVYPATVWTRFGRDENWAELYREVFAQVPFGVRQVVAWQMRRGARASLWGHGVARHSDKEVEEILGGFLDALLVKVDALDGREGGKGKDWLMGGEEPSMVDVCVFAWCANCLGTRANPFVRGRLLGSERLRGWLERRTREWFPEYEGLLKLLKDGE